MALSKIQAESMNLADTYAFSGTVSGTNDTNHLVKLFSSISSSAVDKVETDTVTSSYSNYLLIGNVVATDGQNSSVDIYLRSNDGSSNYSVSSGSNGFAVYQGEWFNRAGSAAPSGNVQNGANHYLRIPNSQDIYGGSIMSFQVHFNVLHDGLLTGTTNISARTVRNGWYKWAMQSTSSSDYYGSQGWFRFDNPNSNLSNGVVGIKVNSGVSNFVKHNVALYGYVE